MNRKPRSRQLWFCLTGCVFGTILVGALLLLLHWYLLYRFQVVSITPADLHLPFLVLIPISIFIGTSITLLVGRFIIRPVNSISQAFDRLSQGDFSVRVPADSKVSEIREISEHFNAMVYDLSHIETLRTDFVVNVSHEFKTPIAAIEGYATLLQDKNLSPERRDYYLDKIIANSRRLSDLSGNVLALSKLENQETVLHRAEYRLDEQLRRAVLLLESKWSAKGLEFDIQLPSLRFYGNEPLLDQVWLNLLDNAIKHSPEGGVIRVGLQSDGDWVTVSVADDGDGMSQEVQKHIFEKFYQGDRSRSDEGNGLGLALVKRIVELCHGSVGVESAPGDGACFRVRLPVEGQ
ncbi:MAG: HAMP domain-containing histidine kinase [Clostridiales bacterium]|nr:HAMP domain-containing histidine kinase [Clostridiales bacterium]